jgi:hypothetical protein
MHWSKIRKLIEERFAPSLRRRVRLELTHYRKAHDAEGRWAIAVDGKHVAGLGCIVADRIFCELQSQMSVDAAIKELVSRGQHYVPLFREQMFVFAHQGIDQALESDDSIVRALALLDKRLGKRRLTKFMQNKRKTSLEQLMLDLRVEAEGMTGSA